MEITNQAIPMQGDRDLLAWAVLEEEGTELSRNPGFFAKPKFLSAPLDRVSWEAYIPPHEIPSARPEA